MGWAAGKEASWKKIRRTLIHSLVTPFPGVGGNDDAKSGWSHRELFVARNAIFGLCASPGLGPFRVNTIGWGFLPLSNALREYCVVSGIAGERSAVPRQTAEELTSPRREEKDLRRDSESTQVLPFR